MFAMRKLIAVVMIPWLANGFACTFPSSTASKDATLSGRVVAENGQPIAHATLQIQAINVQVKTGADGQYTLVVPEQKLTEQVGVLVRADGFAQHVAIVPLQGGKAVERGFLLRPIGFKEQVALPQVGQPPVVLRLAQGETSMELHIGAESLIDSAGQIVTGTVEVQWTAFDAVRDRNVFPAGLLARPSQPGGAPIPLVTYGMADIEIRQANRLLQVAPNRTLGWQVQISPLLQAVMQRYPEWHAPPAIYSLDEVTGLWVEDGNQQNGALTYDSNLGRFQANLPHLTTWNIDGTFLSAGGCIMGTVTDCSGRTMANEDIAVWLLSWENLSVFRAKSDIAGKYCVNVGVSNNNLDPTPYVVTNNNRETNMCNPMPAACSDCPNSGYANCNVFDADCTPSFARCNVRSPSTNYFPYSCAYGNDRDKDYGLPPGGDCSRASNQMGISDCTRKCEPNILSLTPCSYCPGQQPSSCRHNSNNLPITNNCAVANIQLPCRCVQPAQQCDPNVANSCCNGIPCVAGVCGGPGGQCLAVKEKESPCDPEQGEAACCDDRLRCFDRLCLPKE